MPSLNILVQRLKVTILPLDLPCSGSVKVAILPLDLPCSRPGKVTILPLDLPCSGPVTHSGEILTTGKSHGKKPDRFSLNFHILWTYQRKRVTDCSELSFSQQCCPGMLPPVVWYIVTDISEDQSALVLRAKQSKIVARPKILLFYLECGVIQQFANFKYSFGGKRILEPMLLWAKISRNKPPVPHEQTSCASACNTDTTPTQPHRNSNTHRTKNNTTNVVIQQNSRELLMMDILLSETC